MTEQCPKCSKHVYDICDNDCGTYVCSHCNCEFYFNDTQITVTHNPQCDEETK